MDNLGVIIGLVITAGGAAGSGLTWLFMWRSQRRKSAAEAAQAEADASKTTADVTTTQIQNASDLISLYKLSLEDTKQFFVGKLERIVAEHKDEVDALKRRIGKLEKSHTECENRQKEFIRILQEKGLEPPKF